MNLTQLQEVPSSSSSSSHKSPIPSFSLSAWSALATNWQLSGAASRIPKENRQKIKVNS